MDLKWPNDLYVSRRKLAGILAEVRRGSGRRARVRHQHVESRRIPADLHERVTSIESEFGRGVDRYPVFVETLAALSRRYHDLLLGRFDAILDAWRRRAPAAVGARVARSVDGSLVPD